MRGALGLVAMLLAAPGCLLPPATQPTYYYQDVLGASPFTELVVEVDHAPGRAPSEAAQAHLVSTLRNVTSKASVRIVLQETLPGDATKVWTPNALVDLEAQTRSTPHAAPAALLHVLYPAGKYNASGVAGVTMSGTILGPVVVFLDTLREVQTGALPLPNPQPAVERLERATLLHEAGHAMGLVDNGLPMVRDHEDDAHEGHSSNPSSVMYWQVESLNGLRDLLLRDGSVPDQFDADDRADMRAAGGR